jgi:molecular chaperone Hsp33
VVLRENLMAVANDFVAPFSLDGAPVLGRAVRLGQQTIDPILARHAYPRPVALLLGEALALAALIRALLKVDGRVSIQAEGDGCVGLLVAEASAQGLRGYARLAEDAAMRLSVDHALAPRALIGEGALAITLDLGRDIDQRQGIVTLDGDSLAACAESYFDRSEQTPTRLHLAVVEELAPAGARWTAGGLLIQRIAADEARGDTEEGWRTAGYLFDTLTDHELADPGLPMDQLLYRLFHELGVRRGEMQALGDYCPCDRDRLAALLRRFTAEEVSDLIEPDGKLHAKCQFCARLYLIDPAELAGA